MRYFLIFLSLVFSSTTFLGCDTKNALEKDIDFSTKLIHIERFDLDIAQLNETNVVLKIAALQKKYGIFFDDYCKNLYNPVISSDTSYKGVLLPYLKDSITQVINKDIIKTIPNLSNEEQKLNEGFSYLKNYYPDVTIPKLYTADLMMSTNAFDTTLNLYVIDITNYLGSNYSNYKLAGKEDFQLIHTNKELIPYHVLYDFGKEKYLPKTPLSTLLDNMIAEGKMLYFLDAMFPKSADTLKIDYTKSQIEWCEMLEVDMWSFIVEKNYLYSNDANVISNFINDGPFTIYFHTKESTQDDAPSRVGAWIGWQIIKSYAKEHPEIALQELMKNTDSKTILENSGYKPKIKK